MITEIKGCDLPLEADMKFNFKVLRANKGNAKACWLYERQKHVVIDADIEADNGNLAYRKLYEMHPEIKSNWEVRIANVG